MKTIANDGVTVSGDSCGACDGRLVLRNAPNGGFFLGCNNFPSTGCTYKVEPCSEELDRLCAEKEARQRLAAAIKLSKESRVPCLHEEFGLGFASEMKRGMKEAPIIFDGKRHVVPLIDLEWLQFETINGKAAIINPVTGNVVKSF